MIETLRVPVAVRWYTAAEGGRSSGPPTGPTYMTTGHFGDESPETMFSVILTMPAGATPDSKSFTRGELALGFPENVPDFAGRLARGDKFILHEGRRVVAECTFAPSGE
jgi:hypothetical protein